MVSGLYLFGETTMPQQTAGTTGARVLPYNPKRKSWFIRHTGTTDTVHLQMTGANSVRTTTSDISLGAGSGVGMNLNDDGVEQVQAEWSVITVSGNVTITVFESVER